MQDRSVTLPTVIVGPTGIGKTAYALRYAEEHHAEIISADSMQVYRFMNIGTAKPTPAELARVPHHLIDIVDPDVSFSLADYLEQFKRVQHDLEVKQKPYLVVGGTGFYIRALIEGLSLTGVSPQHELRAALQADLKKEGAAALYVRLQQLDPVRAAQLHANNTIRVIRALEIVLATGRPVAEQQTQSEPILPTARLICLAADREVMYERINARVDAMFDHGLIAEVHSLLTKGYNKSLVAFQALGYKEVIEYIEGVRSELATRELIKKRTRNFAKRQMTWWRSFKNVEWVNIAKTTMGGNQ